MSHVPRVSVITPSFNQADFLEQTILSVLEQDYPNLELIVVDGDSSDSSLEIIRKYASRLAWWVSEPDRGQADAVNKGLAQASGQIIGWLNSDDYYLPGAIRQAMNAFEEHPECGLVYGDTLSVDEAGRPIHLSRYGQWGLADFMRFRIIGEPAVFARKTAWEKAGLLDLKYHFLLDHHLWLRIASQTPVYHVPQVWAAARYHSGAKNITHTTEFGREAYEIIQWMEQEPHLAARFAANKRQIWAGAHRLNGWYLSEGKQPGLSLRAYWRSFISSPKAIRQDWRRILATLLEWARLGSVRSWYYQARQRKAESAWDEIEKQCGQKL